MSLGIKKETRRGSETGMVIDRPEGGDLSTVSSVKEACSSGENNNLTKEFSADGGGSVEMDGELVCIDFFLRYLSYLFPLWAEYGDNFMFHITQIYGAFSKSEYHPYIRILESLGLEIGSRQNKATDLEHDFMIGDSPSYPLDIERCDTQTCIKAISYLDSYREWVDNVLDRSGYDFEGHLQLTTEIKEGRIGRPVHEWKLEEITGDMALPLVYQAYVTFDFRHGDRSDLNSVTSQGGSSSCLEKGLGFGGEMGGGVVVKGNGRSSFGSYSPSRSSNEVGVTYEKNRDRWVAVWTENGIRRSRIFNVKQYGFDTAREMAIQYRREQIMNLSSNPTAQISQNPVQRSSKRSRKAIEPSTRALKSPPLHSTRNSAGLDVISIQNSDFEVYFDAERDSWICKSVSGAASASNPEDETVFGVEEFGFEKARQLAIEKAGGISEDPMTQTPVKKSFSKFNSGKGAPNTPKKPDHTGYGSSSSSSSFRIRIANGVVAGTGAENNQQQAAGGRSDSRRSSMDEFLVYHGKKYYFGPVIEGIRYDKIQNRWVTGYMGQDGRKRYKYFSIGAYGFEGSRQLAIEYREGLYPSTKGVDKLSEFLQTVIQGFPAFDDGTLQDVPFEDLIFQKGQIKGGSEKFYLCVPSKGDFLVTTPVEEDDELYVSLVSKYKGILENCGGKDARFLRDDFGGTPRKQQVTPNTSLSKCESSGIEAGTRTQADSGEAASLTETDKGSSSSDSFDDDSAERTKKRGIANSESINIPTDSSNSSVVHQQENNENEGGTSIPDSSLSVEETANSGTAPSPVKDDLDTQQPSGEDPAVCDASPLDVDEDSLFVEVEDKTTPQGKKRLFVGPKVDGVHFNSSTFRWVAHYDQDGVELTKNFSAKTYGFEKSRYLAIEWRTKYNGQPPQMYLLLQALKEQGIEYPPSN